jgi:hypothetical protein
MPLHHRRSTISKRVASAALFASCISSVGCHAAAPDESTSPRRYDPNIDLPISEGRELVLRACVKCHELGGLDAYRGYWNLEQWMEMVVGMVKNGAELLPPEQEVVAAYLTRHFGPGSRNQTNK